MRDKKTYSVIIPVYNSEATLARALSSIQRQSILPMEVIIIDDQSKDASAAIAHGHATLFDSIGIVLKYIQLPVNSGPSVARNTGIRVSNGDYIAFLDADDEWSPAKLEILSHIVDSENPDLIFHTYTEALGNDDLFYSMGSLTKVRRYQLLPLWRLLLSNPAQTSCTVIRRSSHFLFDESMRYCEDHDLWVRLIENGKAIQVIGPPLTRLGRPQLSPGGLSGNRIKMRCGEAQVYKKFCQRRWRSRALLLPALLLLSFFKHVISNFRR
jgi:glycosyltransferase involved in cell wall biosynthesis